MTYYDYMLATKWPGQSNAKKTLVIAPGFSGLKKGDLVKFPGSEGWETVLSSCTMSGHDDMLDMFRAAFGDAVRVTFSAAVKAVEFKDE